MLQANQVADHSPQAKLRGVSRNCELQQYHASHWNRARQGYADAALRDSIALPLEITVSAIANRDRQAGPIARQAAPLNSRFHRYQPRASAIRAGSVVVHLPPSAAVLARRGTHRRRAHLAPPGKNSARHRQRRRSHGHLVPDRGKRARAPGHLLARLLPIPPRLLLGRWATPLLLENRRGFRRSTAAIENPAVPASSYGTNIPAWSPNLCVMSALRLGPGHRVHPRGFR